MKSALAANEHVESFGSFQFICCNCTTKNISSNNIEKMIATNFAELRLDMKTAITGMKRDIEFLNKEITTVKMSTVPNRSKLISELQSAVSDLNSNALTLSPPRKLAKIAWDKDDNPVIDRFVIPPVYPASTAPAKKQPTSYASKVKINVKNSNDTSSNLFRNLHDNRNLIPKYTTKKKSDGSIDVLLQSFEEADKAKSVLMEKMGGTLVSEPLPEKFKKFTLVGLEFEMTTHEVVDSIMDENSWLNLEKVGDNTLALKEDPHAVIQVINVAKCRNASCYKVGIQMSLNMAATVGNKKLSIGHSLCYSYKFVNHRRCYRCQEPGHIANSFKKPIACSRCSSDHFSKNCTSSIMKCINCVRNGKDDVNHPSYSLKCPYNNT